MVAHAILNRPLGIILIPAKQTNMALAIDEGTLDMLKTKEISVAALVALALAAGNVPLCFADEPSKDALDSRITRQRHRIKAGLKEGSISQKQATDLLSTLDGIAGDIAASRSNNGGKLKPEQLKRFTNVLNQNSNQIDSFNAAGVSKPQGANALGPKWTSGPDGAQNPKTLLKRMKAEERRELRQERQATEQKIEQQQMDYEKEMTERLGEQRKSVLQSKKDLEEVRKDSGAN